MRSVSADAIVFRDGKILLVERASPPFEGVLALPGGHLGDDESLEECIRREVLEETSLSVSPVVMVGAYSSPARDPRGTVSIAYICEITGGSEAPGSDASRLVWMEVGLVDKAKLAFDHNRIVRDALALVLKGV